MTAFLGPLDGGGRVPPRQQTRVAAFLISAHGAQARRLAAALPAGLQQSGQTEVHTQFCRATEFVSLLMRSTQWVPDPMLPILAWSWEFAWLPMPVTEAKSPMQSLLIDTAAFGHALHAAIRPAVLLPDGAATTDPFVQALHRMELESARLLQAQILFLRGPELAPIRDSVSNAVERRHARVRELWNAMLSGIGVTRS